VKNMGLVSKFLGKERMEQEKASATAPLPSEGKQQTATGSGTLLVQDAYDIKGVGLVPVGTVQSGSISPGQHATINGKIATVKSIEAQHKQHSIVYAGQNVGINLQGVTKADVKRGDLLQFNW
jgi:selenocysteine-specific translation elongation factor